MKWAVGPGLWGGLRAAVPQAMKCALGHGPPGHGLWAVGHWAAGRLLAKPVICTKPMVFIHNHTFLICFGSISGELG